MNTFLVTILAFLFAIGILVVFHELGHFLVARWFGVKVLRFSVGFGKRIWFWRDKYHTEYAVSAIPLGGYVKLLDEREGPVPDELLPYAFNRQKLGVRFAVVLAGPIFNFIFAFFAYWLMFMIGISGSIPLIGDVKPNSIAAKAGLVANEEIIAVDKIKTETWQQVSKQLMDRLGDKDTLEIEAKDKEGSLHSYYLDLHSWEIKGSKPDLFHGLGIEPYQPPIEPIVRDIVSGEAASHAGMLIGDKIIAVNGQDIKEWKTFTAIVVKSIDIPLTVTVLRNNKSVDLTLTPRAKESDDGERIGFAGLVVQSSKFPDEMLRKTRLGPLDAMGEAITKTGSYILLSFKLIGKMLVGDVGLKTLSGPITIAQGAGATALVGIQYYLGFLALISISLGVLNLLPIPVLDGGHLLYYVIEFFTGKPVSERVQVYGFKIGMMLIIFLMTVAFYNDLMRLF